LLFWHRTMKAKLVIDFGVVRCEECGKYLVEGLAETLLLVSDALLSSNGKETDSRCEYAYFLAAFRQDLLAPESISPNCSLSDLESIAASIISYSKWRGILISNIKRQTPPECST